MGRMGRNFSPKDLAAPSPPILDDQRAMDMWKKWTVFRWPQHKIAKEYGISQPSVSVILANVRAAKELGLDRQLMLLESRETLNEITSRAMELAEKIREGAPVAVGKDGSIFYDKDGKEVRDYSGYLAALKAVAAFDAETAKRFGLDAAQKIETSATVRYEIIGVSDEDLT